MTSIDCIVPAHNEEATVGNIVRVLKASGVFREIIVVDDGSRDETRRRAAEAGADVVRVTPNGGKAEAMLEGVRLSQADDFAFIDADLIGLEPKHIRLLHDHFLCGFDMVCGLQDHGMTNIFMEVFAPIITGQRFIKRWVLEKLDETCWAGYKIETAMNLVTDKYGGETCLVPMKGVTGKLKQAKVGFLKGWAGQFKMAREMREARRAFEATDGQACALPGKSCALPGKT